MSYSIQTILICSLICLGWAANAGYQATSNDASIQTSRVKYACSNGFYWSIEACLSCLSVENGYCKCTTFGGCDTVVCAKGYLNIGNTTVPRCSQQCDANCVQCIIQDNAEQCTTCVTGYELVGGICIQLGNCASLSPNTALCSVCSDGYYNNMDYQNGQSAGMMCSPCMANCLKCGSPKTCQTCNTGSYWSIQATVGQCTPCSALCSDCSGADSCSTCVTGAYRVTTDTTATCSACPTGCSQCSGATTCSQCQTGYGLVSQSCSKCSTGCSQCSSPTQCTTCGAGYVLNTDGTCLVCPSNCATCVAQSGAAACTACVDTFYLASSTSCTSCSATNSTWIRCAGSLDTPSLATLQPTQCTNTLWLISAPINDTASINQCYNFALNNMCLNVLSNTGECAGCFPGYNLFNGKCYTCPASCQTCDKNATVGATSMTCSQCNLGYYQGTDRMCAPCSVGCLSCTNANTCSACQPSFYLDGTQCKACAVPNCKKCDSTGACQTCGDNFYLATTTSGTTTKYQCNQCSTDCQSCSGPFGCSSCPARAILMNTGCLKVQDSGCVYVDSETSECLLCDYSYYLKGLQCLQCVDPSAGFVCRNNTAAIGSNPNTTISSYAQVLITVALILLLQQ